ncbi:MAG: alpha/beta fold hydrolase [Gemmatimonadota bacterium]|nr:alpha/beta fold hydrolase [Gemmatimonadota bacterium]
MTFDLNRSSITVHEHSARDIAGGRRILLSIEDGEHVPGLLLLPTARQRVPAALLLHGYSSRKERMSEVIGMSLLRHGIASLAIDLPLHGERDGEVESLSYRNPFELVQRWRLAIGEARLGLRFLAEHPAIDGARLALVGYSLGSFLGVIVAAQEPLVRAVVLAAGGDLPTRLPFAAIIRTVADPLRAVRSLAGRPLLMVNGRFDRTVAPDQAQRLFDIAAEPKELRWYSGGHWPPVNEVDAAVVWLEGKLSAVGYQLSAER